MSRIRVPAVIFCAVFRTLGGAPAAFAQHEHSAGSIRLGAQAVGLIRHVAPAVLGRNLTEGYLTQPAVLLHATRPGGHLAFSSIVNLEGLTLQRGELDHGVWGEGYIDRRHPHTYLHEAMLTAQGSAFGFGGSLSAGRGFAPFGTDDPMVRPFVSYPANHHLSQILERWVAIAAVRRGPAMLEAGVFNGDEPTGPRSLGKMGRFGDSWAGRVTIAPLQGVELQASYAFVESPEIPSGGGLDQRKWNASARVQRVFGAAEVYGLVEAARNGDMHDELEAFVFRTVLAESGVAYRPWRAAFRFERTSRPEEERRRNLFRSVRPLTDANILGISRWRTVSLHIERDLPFDVLRLTPFAEFSQAQVQSLDDAAVFDPAGLYGSKHINSFSAGVRIGAGLMHQRMGRYGAAANQEWRL